ncbi:glycosyltransferase [Candidatus Planktophila versatilis]|uniref:Colanic acid biosynthesis glycosyltransferase n=1 Tax=Candidatus Planktophila versatilis TaxID=1884905 RepID=A0ABN5BC96_9ACTN|nr:glycosyltransferase [Candidatus Planktophila versatilis]ASY16711.1 colanic acid biosynthesis glycosyltransferase [Candidatus Planktophila versatilis]
MSASPTLTLVTVSAFDLSRLSRTIESCKGMVADLEHLFVIPSNDLESLEAIDLYSKTANFDVRVVHDNKEGIYAAMNLGALSAQGIYCLFLNAGDEVFSGPTVRKNVETLKVLNPIWGVTGVSLPWNANYYAYQSMDKDFRKQKSNGYVSHQSVFVRLDIFKKLNGLDVKFPIAADTKQIFQLSALCSPQILEGIAIKVEQGFNVTSNNRESRIEVLRLINSIGGVVTRLVSNFYFFKRELNFISRYILRLFREFNS